MTDHVMIRALQPGDQLSWRGLWDAYCAFYRTAVPDAATQTLWHRLLDPACVVNGLAAVDGDGQLLGLCHYVLHPYTWSPKLTCYLEDLYTVEAARGRGVGRGLINRLSAMAVEAGWARVYWHTEETNARARILYDKVTGGADGFVRYTIKF